MELTKENTSNGPDKIVSNDVSEIQEVLQAGIKEAAAILRESVSTASNAAQKYEELKQSAEEKVGQLEVQLQEKEESLRMKESANRQMEESFTAKIHDLEHQLTEKEGLLEEASQEVMNFRSDSEAIVLRLQAKLQGNGKHLETREAELIDHTSSEKSY